jgi:hypothetical protein
VIQLRRGEVGMRFPTLLNRGEGRSSRRKGQGQPPRTILSRRNGGKTQRSRGLRGGKGQPGGFGAAPREAYTAIGHDSGWIPCRFKGEFSHPIARGMKTIER